MPDYDLILKGGTVLDPRNGFDGSADLAVRNGKIEAVEPEIDLSRADEVVDVSGLWVMPGSDRHPRPRGGIVSEAGIPLLATRCWPARARPP